MITLDGLRKEYSDFLLDVDLVVEKGRIVSILGPSGSGKTTVLRLTAGFESPDSGRVIVGGTDVTRVDPSRRGVGLVFQDYTLFPHMSVHDNVAYGLKYSSVTRAEREATVSRLLKTVGLAGFGARDVRTLSGGEQQRVAIARAVAVNPAVLLLDEPFSSIDAPQRKGLRAELVRVTQELSITTVFVTHSRDEALSISDMVVVMRNGRVVAHGTPVELYETPKSRFVAEFLGEANVFSGKVSRSIGDSWRLEAFRAFTVDGSAPGVSEATIMIRPERVAISSRATGQPNEFVARIIAAQYFGAVSEYTLECDGVTIVAASPMRFARGDTVYGALEPSSIVVLDDPQP
ncbi:MAG: ABC transporter ATP-binding protein [Spirochaetaceae bacterium]|nr:MAG: ABC transporter ATP-binding protein [Spirochaetaceae bacterium]